MRVVGFGAILLMQGLILRACCQQNFRLVLFKISGAKARTCRCWRGFFPNSPWRAGKSGAQAPPKKKWPESLRAWQRVSLDTTLKPMGFSS